MKKKRIIIGIIIFIISLIMILGVTALIFYTLITTDNCADKYTLRETDDTFLETILKGAAFGEEFELTDTQVNTYVNQKYCGVKNDTGAENIMIYFHKDAPTEIYARIMYRGLEMSARAEAEIGIDRNTSIISVKLKNAYLGELKLSDASLSRILNRLYGNSSFIEVDGTALKVTACYTFKIKNIDIHVYLKEFSPADEAIHCRSNSLTGEAVRAAAEYFLSDEGRQKLSDIYNGIKDKFSSIIN